MTVRVTVSLPDDLGEALHAQDNASAYVAEALRMRMATEHTRQILRRTGYPEIPDSDIAEARRQFDRDLARRDDPALREHTEARLALLRTAST